MNWVEKLYLLCAAIGGGVLVLQTALSVFGGDHGDVHHDVSTGDGHDSALSLLSLRSVSAFLAFFGLGGWGAERAGWPALAALGTGLGAGLVMLVAVALLFRLPHKLHSEGNLDPLGAVGKVARVYLRIPAANSGKGKITLVLQGRTAEFHAFTNGAEIPTGAEVTILRMVTQDTFEVALLA